MPGGVRNLPQQNGEKESATARCVRESGQEARSPRAGVGSACLNAFRLLNQTWVPRAMKLEQWEILLSSSLPCDQLQMAVTAHSYLK